VRASTRRRAIGVGGCVALLGASTAVLAEPLARVLDELALLERGFIVDYTTSLLLAPELSASALQSAVRESAVPVAVGVLATFAAVLLAAALSFPASVAFQLEPGRFTGERATASMRARRLLLVAGARGLGLLLRGIPEVAWVVLLLAFFRSGPTPCVVAVAIHSTGVLLRVFTETIDNIPYRRLEQVSGACRPQIFLYGALPEAWRDWKTYALFQLEVNVRIGIVLGMVGAGGLGDKFHSNLLFRDNHRAGTYLWAMVLITVAIDRLSRRLTGRRLQS
jgi:phosphonate transport system permease protein